MQTATAYLTAAMLAWTPVKVHPRLSGETAAHAEDRYGMIARDVARVACTDTAETPVYPEPNARLRTALWLVAQAKCETELDARVDRGACPRGMCDSGHAWGLWQIHAADGLTFEGLRFRRFVDRPKGWLGVVYDGPSLTADRATGARMALHMRRVSKYFWTTWQCAETLEREWSKKNTPAWCAP